MSMPRKRVITAHDVEAAAYAGVDELSYDAQSSIVTPLARARANDLGVALRSSGSASPRRKEPRPAKGASTDGGGGSVLEKLRPELAAEVLRRVQRRLEQR